MDAFSIYFSFPPSRRSWKKWVIRGYQAVVIVVCLQLGQQVGRKTARTVGWLVILSMKVEWLSK